MSSYGGRRGPNVTQYLNALQSDAPNDDAFTNIDDDLALFTNTQFYDFDTGCTTDFQAPPVKAEPEQTSPAPKDGPSASPMADLSSMDFIPDFTFPDFPYSNPLPGFPDGLPIQSLPTSNAYVQSPQQQVAVQTTTARAGDKRKASESLGNPDRALSFEEQSRIAAEEDKRRRNTAASARFRVKKKQREQALEKSAKEMSEKVTALEGKIQQLETENKWLKNMILEKNGGNEQIAALLEKGLNTKDTGDGGREALKEVESLSKTES